MYYNYGNGNAECNVHVIRYLKSVTDFTNHKWTKNLFDLLIEMKNRKEELMDLGMDGISNIEYENYKNRCLKILEEGKIEYLNDLKTNSYKDNERILLTRLKEYVDNHLLFLRKFYVSFSNNRTEADLRFVKIKQKIEKFRSVEGANNFVVIRSYTSTCSKNEKSLATSLKAVFNKLFIA